MKSTSSKFIIVALVLIVIGAFCFQCLDYINFTVDDVFITFRVAENVSHGNGYVYNVGEFIEGYSNWLWVTMLSFFMTIGINQSFHFFAILITAKVLTFLFGVINLILIHQLAKKIIADSEPVIVRFVPVLIAATSGAFSLWTMSAMETQLCSMFYLIAALQIIVLIQWDYSKDRINIWRYFLIGICWLGAMLTRPEPILHAFASIAFLLFILPRTEKTRLIIYSVGVIILGFSVFIIWRYLTYHSFVPNTFYAKAFSVSSRLLLSLKYSFSAFGFLTGPMLLFFVISFFQWKKPGRSFYFFLLMIACSVFFVIYSGGDSMPAYRFYIPIFGFAAVICGIGFSITVDAFKRVGSIQKISPYLIVIIVLFVSGVRIFEERTLIRGTMPDMASGFRVVKWQSLPEHIVIADWVHDHTNQNARIACGEAGIIGYRNMNMKLLDLNGLMDENIAQQRQRNESFSADYILDQKPDYIILYNMFHKDENLIESSPIVYYVGAFIASKRFAQEYQLCFQYFSFGIYKRLS